MPCTYYTKEEEAATALQEYKHLKSELDLATSLLCSTCKHLLLSIKAVKNHYDNNIYIGKSNTQCLNMITNGLGDWYEKHEVMDEQRIKDSIKKKLTQEEIAWLDRGL